MLEADFSLGEYTAKGVACRVGCAEMQGVGRRLGRSRAHRRSDGCTLFEAAAAALATFCEDEWVDQIGNGLTTICVTVRQPAVQH
jgi:hypothetical protein